MSIMDWDDSHAAKPGELVLRLKDTDDMRSLALIVGGELSEDGARMTIKPGMARPMLDFMIRGVLVNETNMDMEHNGMTVTFRFASFENLEVNEHEHR